MTWNFLKRWLKHGGIIPDPEPEHDLQRIETTKPTVIPFLTGSPGVSGPPGGSIATIPLPPATFAQVPGSISIAPTPDVMLSIKSPDGVDSIVIEANGRTIMEAWDTKAAMVGRDQEVGNRPIGSLGFARGLAYIMTRGGWVNLGEALEKPLEMTDRRGMIAAQKARNRKEQ